MPARLTDDRRTYHEIAVHLRVPHPRVEVHRNLQALPGYTPWQNYTGVIEKAKEACQTSDNAISDHFIDVNKMILLGSERIHIPIHLTNIIIYI